MPETETPSNSSSNLKNKFEVKAEAVPSAKDHLINRDFGLLSQEGQKTRQKMPQSMVKKNLNEILDVNFQHAVGKLSLHQNGIYHSARGSPQYRTGRGDFYALKNGNIKRERPVALRNIESGKVKNGPVFQSVMIPSDKDKAD